MSRYKVKVRQWATGRNVTNPFDVVILDTESNIMYCSPRTLTEEEAKTFSMNMDNINNDFAASVLKDWLVDGSIEDFNVL